MKDYIVQTAIALAVVLCAYFLGRSDTSSKYKEHTQKAVIKQLKVDASATAAASSVREKARAAEVIHKEKVNEATSKALAENPDWAAQPVPDSVIDAIGM